MVVLILFCIIFPKGNLLAKGDFSPQLGHQALIYLLAFFESAMMLINISPSVIIFTLFMKSAASRDQPSGISPLLTWTCLARI